MTKLKKTSKVAAEVITEEPEVIETTVLETNVFELPEGAKLLSYEEPYVSYQLPDGSTYKKHISELKV